MNSICKATITLFSLIGLQPNHAHAQFLPSKYEFGIHVGTLIYQGDLSKSAFGYTRSLSPAVAIDVSRSFDSYFSLRAGLIRGEIGADESTYASPVWRRFRNLKFSSSITEFSTELVWDLSGKTYREGFHRLSPYFFAGGGFTLLNVKRDWSRFDKSYFNSKSSAYIGLAMDTLHRTPGIIPVIPVGAGLRYMVTNHLYINMEGTYRITTSDYIDGFKYAGDPTKNDHYYSLSVGISYRLGDSKMNCPKSPI
jgi:hypothetical protein